MSDLDRAAALAALAPVREALLARAHADAEERVSAAEAEARTKVEQSEAQARAVVEEADRQGDADAAVVLAGERARVRRQARGVVLAAQREAYEALLRRCHEEAAALRADPAYPAAVARLSAQARALLDEDAEVTEDPAGGVVARSGRRRVELTLAVLAEREVQALGQEVEKLWAP